MLCLTALALGAPAARAGSYAVSFSGGSYEYGIHGDTAPDYDDGGGDYSAGPATSVQSTFTVTCTWVPDDPNNPQADPPPQNVVLDETGYAYWEANGGTTTDGGSCSDGLGDPEVPNTDSLPYLTSGSSVLNNDHYSVHAGGASFTYTRTPTVSSGGDNQGTMIYSVGVSPINLKVVLGGVQAQDDGQVALTGQQVTATVIDATTGQPYPARSYSWSAGGNAFETWDPGAPNASHATQLVPLSAADIAAQQFKFYDAVRDDAVTVSCTVPYLLPDGTTEPITVQSQPVTFLKPTATWQVNRWARHKAAFVDLTQSQSVFGAMVYWYPVTVTDPPNFTGGNVCFAQVAELQRSNSGNTLGSFTAKPTVTWQQMKVSGGVPPSTYLTNYPLGLDYAFPYQVANEVDDDGNYITYHDQNQQEQVYQSPGYQWAVGQDIASGDFPEQSVNPSAGDPTDGAGITWTYAGANDTFNTWLMYQPDGGVWVPLQRLGWAWSGTAAIDKNGNWTAKGPTPPASQGMPTDTPPAWSVTVLQPTVYP